MTAPAGAPVRKPQLVLIAGGNGSGKSTLWDVAGMMGTKADPSNPLALARDLPYFNTDEYFKILIARDPKAQFQEATNWRNKQVSEHIRSGLSFVSETVFDQGKLGFLKSAKKKGYETTVHFVGLDSPELAVERVQARVAEGGHDIPQERIRKKWFESLQSANLAVTRATQILFYDNSTDAGARLVAKFENAILTYLYDNPPSWLSQMPIVKQTMAAGVGALAVEGPELAP